MQLSWIGLQHVKRSRRNCKDGGGMEHGRLGRTTCLLLPMKEVDLTAILCLAACQI